MRSKTEGVGMRSHTIPLRTNARFAGYDNNSGRKLVFLALDALLYGDHLSGSEQAAGKLCRHARTSMVRTCGTTEEYFRRILKKAVQQGRSERRGEEVQTALRVGRSPLE